MNAFFQRMAGGVLAAACAGCLSSAPPPATAWPLAGEAPAALPAAEPRTPFAATRLGGISVLAPYDQPAFAVLRADGSLAFDSANRFAAAPAALLKGPLLAALAQDGRFGHVVAPSSVVSTDAVVEVLVPELALDCRTPGQRFARAAIEVNVIANGRARTVALAGRGAAEVDAAAGDYGAAFGAAVGAALAQALSNLK